jgi:predicted HicB family RNase H-like nuclease
MSSPQETTTDFHNPTIANQTAPHRGFSSATAYADELAAMDQPTARTRPESTPGHPSVGHPSVGHSSVGHSAHGYTAPGITASGTTATGTAATAERAPATRLTLSPIRTSLPVSERPAEVLRLQIEAFAQTDNWVVMYRELLGVDGVVRKLFKTADEIRQWESSREFDEIHSMLAVMRSQDNGKGETIEAQRMITVRLPASMHEALKVESDESGLSINKLCITKLLQKMDARFVPLEPGKRRGRKPGPQGKRSKKTSE